jgi:hypothetical protein
MATTCQLRVIVNLLRLQSSNPNLQTPFHQGPSSSMTFPNVVKCPNGEILTGRQWRRDLSFFNDLPFYSNILRMDEIAGPLRRTLDEVGQQGFYGKLLMVR